MSQEDKQQETKKDQPSNDSPKEALKWERGVAGNGILVDLLQPILGSFVLLLEEESKRTLEKMEQAKKTLERLKENR